ncbi:MAG: fibronectin type III domain-containing protein, partial [Thermoguttaceae bacterium]|nr:fibronectin type III domain-containing protein [Thermoguttaceae bacterium]
YTLAEDSQALGQGEGGSDLGAFKVSNETPSLVVTVSTDVVDPTDGEISLREALAYMANDATLGKSITFDASLDGATIYLTQGELEFTNNTTGNENKFRGLKIDASALANGITIDAQDSSRVFRVFKTTGMDSFRATFNNLTIANGYAEGNGGGIYSALDVVLVDCDLIGNEATGAGAGVYSAGATVSGSYFNGNLAWGGTGGGLYFTGSNMSITDSTFEQNGSAAGSGGGIYATGSNNTFDSLTFVENAALNNGGGLALDGAGKQKQATNLTFENNVAFSGNGGGLYFAGSNTTFDGLTLVGNEAGANGGGFYGAATLTNSTIVGNFASVDGCGIFSTGGNISKTLIADNVADGFGGGLRLYGAGSKLTNVTIAGNVAADGAGVYSQSYNAYYNSIILANVDWTGAASDVAHNGSYRSVGYNVLSTNDDWDAAPVWGSKQPSSNTILYSGDYTDVFVDSANGDYSLAYGSPAIGEGDVSYVLTETDLAGADRVRYELVDLGAFESPYAVTLAAPSLTAEAISASEIILTVGDVANASGYVVEYSLSADFANAVAVDGSTLAGLNAYTTYYFRVKSLGENSYVDSAWSTPVSATTKLTAPAIIVNQLKRSAKDGTVLNCKWRDAFDENAEHYRVEYREAGTEEWLFVDNWSPELSEDNSQLVYDFTPGQTYDFRVRAENADVYSDWSTASITAMVAPTFGVAAIDANAKTAIFTFSAP